MTMSAEDRVRFDELHRTVAARRVRWLLDEKVAPRVGVVLDRARRGAPPVIACDHLGKEKGTATGSIGVFDWLCEGRGLMCSDCALDHLMDLTTPHRDTRLECCIVCGHVGQDLHALAARVELGEPMMTMNSAVIALARERRRPVAVAIEGSFITTPVAFECPAHDGFLDTEVTLRWPPIER